jgi:uncharacterized membrane protein YidH (DUF202 family)
LADNVAETDNKAAADSPAGTGVERRTTRRICDLFCRFCGKREITEVQRIARVRSRRVHMANERTFLSWIRTSIGIMAFGFVVEKFSLFVRQIAFFFGKASEGGSATSAQAHAAGYSSTFGIMLIGLGALMGLLAFVRYKKVERQIDEDTYRPSVILDIMLTLVIFSMGFFLVIYLIHSI